MKLAFLAAALAVAAPAAAQTFDRAAWIADFEQIKDSITRQSPNLDWAIERGFDMPAVERRARDRLAVATSDVAARDALTRFVRNFADGHMEISWPSPASSQPASAPAARPTCAALGYRSAPDEYGIASGLPGYVPVGPQDGQIRAGTAPLAGKTVGVLRVPLFKASDALCAAVLKERGMSADAPCDEACADLVARRADDLFLADIADRLRLLDAARADVLLLDVAGNGGGHDTSIALARMIGGADVPTPLVAFPRTAAWLKNLTEQEAALRSAAADRPAPADRALTRRLTIVLEQARAEAARPCDLSPLWQGRPAGCSNLIRGPFYAGGLVPLEPAGGFGKGKWAEAISSTAGYTYTPGQWTRPVLVLVDGNSGSTTELLASMLQDARRAIIVGTPTFGAGCGWFSDRQDVVLTHSGGILAIPNCARFRRDGRNEVDGVQPDVLVGFRQYDTPQQRAGRLAARLPVAIEMAMSGAR